MDVSIKPKDMEHWIRVSLRVYPYVFGFEHPLEREIEDSLLIDKDWAMEWIRPLCCGPKPDLDFISLMGRIDNLDLKFKVELITHCLRSSDIQVRDAAIQCAEEWGGEKMEQILRNHLKTETCGFLADYAEKVINEMDRGE